MATSSSSLANAQTLRYYRIPGILKSPGVPVSPVVSGLKSGPCSRKQGSWAKCPQAGLEPEGRLSTRKEGPEVGGGGGKADRMIPRGRLRPAQIKQSGFSHSSLSPLDLGPTVPDTIKVKPWLLLNNRNATAENPSKAEVGFWCGAPLRSSSWGTLPS